MNYRYHWHADDYELSILLYGVQSYCRGSENSLLHEDDVILTVPGNGHASMTQAADTCALVLDVYKRQLRSVAVHLNLQIKRKTAP